MNAFCVSTDPSANGGRSDKVSRPVLGGAGLTSLENIGHDHGSESMVLYGGMNK